MKSGRCKSSGWRKRVPYPPATCEEREGTCWGISTMCTAFMCVCVYSPSNPVAHPFLTPVGPHRANRTANVSSGRLGCVSYNGELSPKSQLFSYAPSVKSDLHENSLVQQTCYHPPQLLWNSISVLIGKTLQTFCNPVVLVSFSVPFLHLVNWATVHLLSNE